MSSRLTTSRDTLFNKIVENVQLLLNAALNNSDDSSTAGNRVQILPALQRKIAITEKLENYFRESLAVLKEQEEAQKKLRADYRYFHLPRLPNEIILRILSRFQSWNVVNTAIPDAVTVTARGLLPHLIFKSYLAQSPYCGSFDGEMALEDISNLVVEIPTITDVDVSESVSVSLEVDVRDWEVLRDDAVVLRSLLQNPRLWKDLRLTCKYAKHIPLVLNAVAPCIPYLQTLYVKGNTRARRATPSPSSFVSNTPMIASSLREAKLILTALPFFFNTGALDFITSLTLYSAPPFFDEKNSMVMSILPQILSNLPCLKALVFFSLRPYNGESSLKVRSSTLRSLEIWPASVENTYSSVLALFSDCPIERLWIDDEKVDLAQFVDVFPGVKFLYCNATDDLSILCSLSTDGRAIFPRLRKLKIYWARGISDEDSDRIREHILESVRIRSSTSSALRVQTLEICAISSACVDSLKKTLARDAWEEKLKQHVNLLNIETIL